MTDQARRSTDSAGSSRTKDPGGVVAASVLGVVHAFGELRPALMRRGDELLRMAALSTRLKPALLNVPRRIRRPMGSPGPTVTPYVACRRSARRLSVNSGHKKRKGEYLSLPLSTYSAPGGLPQAPIRAAESSAEARTYGNGSH